MEARGKEVAQAVADLLRTYDALAILQYVPPTSAKHAEDTQKDAHWAFPSVCAYHSMPNAMIGDDGAVLLAAALPESGNLSVVKYA